MKRLCALIVALVMLTSVCSAALPSGMKNAALDSGSATAVIELTNVDTMPDMPNPNWFDTQDIKFNVRMLAATEGSTSFKVTASCGSKSLEDTVIAAEGTSTVKEYTLAGVEKGMQKLSIKVSANGADVAAVGGEYKIAPTVKTSNLAPYTRLLGFSTTISTPRGFAVYKNMGLTMTRGSFGQWKSFEKTKGVFDWTNFDAIMKLHKEHNLQTLPIVGLSNPLYMDRNDAGNKSPQTKEHFDGYARYIAEMAKRFPELKYYEIWNEPNGKGFWGAPATGVDYTYMTEIAEHELKKVDPDGIIAIGSVANADSAFIQRTYTAGMFPYTDAVSYHPYTRPSTVDQSMGNSVDMVHNVIMKNGGWKIPLNSEIGWPTNDGDSGIPVEQHAIEMVKTVALMDYYGVPMTILYQLYDNGKDPLNSEDHYGTVYVNTWEPKPAYFSIREFSEQTSGAVALGRMDTGIGNADIRLYLKDGKLLGMGWNNTAYADGKTVDVTIGGSGISAVDLYGNPTQDQGNVVTLEESPKYITGIPKAEIAKSLKYNIEEILAKRFSNFDVYEGKKGYAEVKNLVYATLDIASEVENAAELPTEEEAIGMLERHYALSDEIIALYKNGELELDDVAISGILYLNHLVGEYYGNLYMASVTTAVTDEAARAVAKYEEAKAALNAAEDDNTLSYSDAMLRFVQEYVEKAEGALEINNPMKDGVVKAWGKMSELVSGMVIGFSGVETVRHDNVIIQLPSAMSKIDLGTPKALEVSVYNYREETPLSGYVEIIDPNGAVVGKSDELTLQPDEDTVAYTSTTINQLLDGDYRMRFIENGEAIVDRKAGLEVKEKVQVQMVASQVTFDEIKTIDVKVTNVYGAKVEGILNVKPKNGWTLATEAQNFKLDAEESVILSFGVTQKEKTPYHFYMFDLSVEEEGGGLIFQKTTPMDFAAIVKADKTIAIADFDGDISDWSNAYPIYMDVPEDPTNYEQWMTEDIGARMLMKWDEDYYYILCDVYDNYHANMQAGSNIWNGDSIQLAFDPLNDGGLTGSYKPDDYEYGFARTEVGGDVVYCWANAGAAGGSRPAEWSNILVDRDAHLTRYFMRIPMENLSGLTKSEGTKFRFNFLINDGDVSTREQSKEYTPGISSGKNPGLYQEFCLLGKEEQIEGDSQIPIPLNFEGISQSESNVEYVSFTDVAGHPMEKYINGLASSGYVKGVGDNRFEPDRSVTRAEFVAMVINAADVLTDYERRAFADVEITDVLGAQITAAANLGWIPSEMALYYFEPDKIISREEAFYIANKWLEYKNAKLAEYRPMWSIEDVTDISGWAAESFQNMYDYRIIDGDSGTKMLPKSDLSRAAAAKIIWNILNTK